ncbi:MAG: thiol-disulfide oxidoreductase DCC family protein [Gammaproteobacteria bacterium]
MSTAYQLQVFYDGVCPMCSKEIAHYRRLAGAEQVEWIDIHQAHARLEQEGLAFDDALARFHVKDSSGTWHIGASGFIALWEVLPRYRWAAKTIRILRLTRLLDALYERFARWRLRRQNACADQCAPKQR